MSLTTNRMSVKVDLEKNRLCFIISGIITKTELDKLYTDIRFSVADLKPPFDIITDLSGCDLGMLSGLPTFRKIMNFLISSDVGSVIRVTEEQSLIHKQAVNFGDRFKSYKTLYVSSVEEAEKMLEEGVSRNRLRICLQGQTVRYTCNGREQVGTIDDISFSGCAVEPEAVFPAKDEEMVLKIFLESEKIAPLDFVLKVKVVRVEEKKFEVVFINADEVFREGLRAYLVSESVS